MAKKPKPQPKPCESPDCVNTARPGERFCSQCRYALVSEMHGNGYFTHAPRFAGHWSGASRTVDQRENIRETKHGHGH